MLSKLIHAKFVSLLCLVALTAFSGACESSDDLQAAAQDTGQDVKAEIDEKALPLIKMKTSKGDVVIELYEDEAPNTVANFITLAESGFYNGLTFHRVIDGFMAQGGCPIGTGTGGPGHAVKCECYTDKARKHERGSLSMAHAGKDTGGSQFFICFVNTPHLDGKHTVFGKVTEGMDVVDKLNRTGPGAQADKMLKVTVTRKRRKEYKVEKLPSRQ
ncbi:MAG: peptidylprolyl isomerase [Pirellulales bacterium]|nr:peptidylprolyl isomerase [Pirellulales bacterium]